MYSLEKIDSGIRICFDSLLTPSRLGPFSDIIDEYMSESGLKPQIVDFPFSCKFVENGSKIQFYWNGGFSVFVFGIEKQCRETVYERLLRITSRLNDGIK